ncbi:hypothetical protein [Nocardia wallacei]|uniref:hypothetical protein n=1 Tax=Nocardia wallacei TaxID=480035 RepID=UPI002455F6E8|nr:hypothetical protein [Nocardia wallacei]
MTEMPDVFMPDQYAPGYPAEYRFSPDIEKFHRELPRTLRGNWDNFGSEAASGPPQTPAVGQIEANTDIDPRLSGSAIADYKKSLEKLGQWFTDLQRADAQIADAVRRTSAAVNNGRSELIAAIRRINDNAHTAPIGRDENQHILQYVDSGLDTVDRIVRDITKKQHRHAGEVGGLIRRVEDLTRPPQPMARSTTSPATPAAGPTAPVAPAPPADTTEQAEPPHLSKPLVAGTAPPKAGPGVEPGEPGESTRPQVDPGRPADGAVGAPVDQPTEPGSPTRDSEYIAATATPSTTASNSDDSRAVSQEHGREQAALTDQTYKAAETEPTRTPWSTVENEFTGGRSQSAAPHMLDAAFRNRRKARRRTAAAESAGKATTVDEAETQQEPVVGDAAATPPARLRSTVPWIQSVGARAAHTGAENVPASTRALRGAEIQGDA